MEFIQKKTADNAVEHFLPKAADKGYEIGVGPLRGTASRVRFL